MTEQLGTVMSEGGCLSLDVCMFSFRFSSHISYYRVLRRVPCAMQWVLADDFYKE